MMDFLSLLVDLLQRFGPWAIIILLVVLFLRILLDEDKAALLRARIYKVAFSITGRREQEKRYISNDVKGRLNLARRRIHLGKEILPKAIDVDWVPGGKGGSYDLKEGEFVVRLDPSAEQAQNIARLATAIVKRTTLAGFRHSMEPSLQVAIDINLVRQLLLQVRNAAALDWFLSEEYQPTVTCNERTGKRNEQIVAIDDRGLFTRLLLVELEQFSKEMRGRPPRAYMAGESEGLVEFLYKLCTKQLGQEVPLRYHRAFIRIGVIIVAKTAKLLQSLEPYLKAMQIHVERESNAIYVLAFDKEWLGEFDREAHRRWEEQVSKLGSEFERATVVTKDFDVEYICTDQAGNTRRARCIRFVTPAGVR